MTSSRNEAKQDHKSEPKTTSSDFTIEHILNRAGSTTNNILSCKYEGTENSAVSVVPFPWVHCTRYCPPKIPSKYLLSTDIFRVGKQNAIQISIHQ